MHYMPCRNLIPSCCFVLILFICSCKNISTEESFDAEGNKIVSPKATTETGKGIPQGYSFNKNWNMSVEAGAFMVGLYTDSIGITYAISNYGAIYSSVGNLNWKREAIDVEYSRLNTIGGYGDYVYAAGSNSSLFYKKRNSGWEGEKINDSNLTFTAIYAFKNELWLAAGNNGSIWHRDSTGKWKQELNIGRPIYGLYGHNDELWVLSKSSVYHKKPGKPWTITLSVDKDVSFYTLCRNNKSVWVMGSGGNIYCTNNGEQWTKENSGKIEDNITCSCVRGDEVFAAGSKGLIAHRSSDGQWKKEENIYDDVFALCMYCHKQDIWIGCNDGFIIHKNNNGPWAKEAGPTRQTKINAFSSKGDTIFAAGDFSTILTRTPNNNWIKAGSLMPEAPLTGIFKYNKDILVTGNNGTIFHRLQDGEWRLENTHSGNATFSDLYESGDNIYLAGSHGTIAWRSKTDTAWKSTVITSYDLTKIYGYGDDIWVMGHHSTLMHKKEKDTNWQPINIRTSEVDFIDAYVWKHQIWALGVKDDRMGIMFHKDTLNNWAKENLPVSLNHYHALYGHGDTIFAAGASGYWGLKYKTDANYQGVIICKEGNKPWEQQMDYFRGVHFDAINGIGDDIYAIGNKGHVFHKKGDNDWQEEETYHDNNNLTKLIFYKGLVMLSNNGFLYKDKNYISIDRTDDLVNIIALDDYLFCISKNAIFKISPGEEKYPVIDKVNYTLKPFINPTSVDLSFELKRPRNLKSSDKYQIEVFARPYNEDYDQGVWLGPYSINKDVKTNYEANSMLVSTNIEVAKSLRVNPELESANKICLRVDLTTEDGRARESFVLKDSNGNSFFTLSNNVWIKYKTWIILAGLLVFYYAVLFFIRYYYPLVLLQLYHSQKIQQLLSLKPPFHLLIEVLNVLLPLKKLVETARVQNAWIIKFAPVIANKYEKSEIPQFRSNYVPLPVRKGNPVTGDLIEKPEDSMLNNLFDKRRTIIQVIGPGGAGKTTLAVAMGNWIIQSTKSGNHRQIPRMPILIEADSKNLLPDITKMLRSWLNDYSIQEDFVRMLLKSQRLVVIADSLSERPTDIQEYFKTLHGDVPVNALIITARQPIDLQVKEGIHLYPLPLDSNNLLHFITTYINIYPNHSLRESRHQLAFAERIVHVIEGNNNNKVPVTPILVKLIIEIAVKTEDGNKKTFEDIYREMPDSIPDVYYKYLANVNPSNPAAPNFLPKQTMLQIAELLGHLSLDDNFIPHDFAEEAARKAVSVNFSHITGDPIQRFIDNGILTRKESLARSYLRFNIDPLAEYLAASKLYDENNTSEEQLAAFIEKINSLSDEALEFKMAFSQICEYKMKHG